MNFIVEEGNVRIDKYLMEKTGLSRSHFQKLINNEKVLVNGKSVKASYSVTENDEIEVMDLEEVCDIVAEDIRGWKDKSHTQSFSSHYLLWDEGAKTSSRHQE